MVNLALTEIKMPSNLQYNRRNQICRWLYRQDKSMVFFRLYFFVLRSTVFRNSLRKIEVSGNLARFPAENGALARQAPVIAGQRSGLAQCAVARNHEGHRVGA